MTDSIRQQASYWDAWNAENRERAVSDISRDQRETALAWFDEINRYNLEILEVGCGNGGVLLELLSYGADPQKLHGADLLAERAAVARQRLPHLPISAASGTALPYPDDSFDLVLQFTVFSSILDQGICYTVANEIRRVLRPGGAILWYDFWINPLNKQTRGIRPSEIKAYFPECRYTFDRITLAPPLARRLVPLSWSGALFLEKLRVFNTHYLVIVRPQS